MTRAQLRVYNRLAKKQVNRTRDVVIVEESVSSVTFFVAFPGLYLSYDSCGSLIESQTETERERAKRPLAKAGAQQLTLQGELADYRPKQSCPPVEIDDDDVPF